VKRATFVGRARTTPRETAADAVKRSAAAVLLLLLLLQSSPVVFIFTRIGDRTFGPRNNIVRRQLLRMFLLFIYLLLSQRTDTNNQGHPRVDQLLRRRRRLRRRCCCCWFCFWCFVEVVILTVAVVFVVRSISTLSCREPTNDQRTNERRTQPTRDLQLCYNI